MGKVSEKTVYDATKGQQSKVFCAKCAQDTNHLVLQSVKRTGQEEIGGDPDGGPFAIDWWNCYETIECQGCETVSFRHTTWFSEAEHDWGGGTSTALYPERSQSTRPIQEYHSVPGAVRRIYRETIACFNDDSFTLCAAGLRAMIEAVCSDRKVRDGLIAVKMKDGTTQKKRRKTLEGKIAGLCEKGILTQGDANALHEHRYLGNYAVHELGQPSSTELELAIDILEHTLAGLYEMPGKTQALQRMRGRRTKARRR